VLPRAPGTMFVTLPASKRLDVERVAEMTGQPDKSILVSDCSRNARHEAGSGTTFRRRWHIS
jgi:hypothetical protein